MKRLIAPLALAALAALAPLAPAQAIYYTSDLIYTDQNGGTGGPFGTVTLQEFNSTTVKISVALAPLVTGYVNTGGADKNSFVFNLTGPGTFVIQDLAADFSTGSAGNVNVNQTPFGIFTNGIDCCGDANGASGTTITNQLLTFSVVNTGGISKANFGLSGPKNGGQPGGFLFGADILSAALAPGGSATFDVASKVFIEHPGDPGDPTSPTPEAATWSMMIIGFGFTGGTMRRRKSSASKASVRYA